MPHFYCSVYNCVLNTSMLIDLKQYEVFGKQPLVALSYAKTNVYFSFILLQKNITVCASIILKLCFNILTIHNTVNIAFKK